MNTSTKNTIAYAATALLGAGMIITAAWGVSQHARAEASSRLAEEYVGAAVNSCARCGRELSDCVSEMSVSLSKLEVTSSTEGQVLALEDIVRESAEAAQLVSQLPKSHVEVMELSNFLTRAGDYARTLSRGLLSGEELKEDDRAQLKELLASCEKLSADIANRIANGEMPIGTEEFDYYDYAPEGEADAEGSSEDDPSEPEYPTLIYDGPFSESTEKLEPLGVTGGEATLAEAAKKANSIAGCELQYDGKSEGRIPTYDFSGGGADISLTVRGLHLIRFISAPSGSKTGIPSRAEYEKLVRSGKAFLEENGYHGMTPTYAQYYNGAAVISFAWKSGEVTVYNDLVKVWIDRDNLKPSGIDARNYLFSHHERDIPIPAITRDEAAKSVSQNIEVRSARLALIPLSPQKEALCYEFSGTYGGSEYLVYVNAQTGREEQIFKIISDENGESAV
ncbi:MAG: germination protein YpeB [Clostridia bacterium]|nr:germination protein YpeB [Clostridia bacterium]